MILHLTTGEVAYCDSRHEQFVQYKWELDSQGYVVAEIPATGRKKFKYIKLHKIIASRNGLDCKVMFKDGDKLNCRDNNIVKYMRKVGKTGVKGVSMLAGKYVVNLYDPRTKKLRYFGQYKTLEEATAKVTAVSKTAFQDLNNS